jgi:hypothetical protein
VKSSKFFCENCHREVKPNARVCPHCGRYFTAVRCPSCGYVGEARDFASGCPNCGYAGTGKPQEPQFETVDLQAGRTAPAPRGVPGWVYPLAAAVLLAVFGVLVVIYLRLA